VTDIAGLYPDPPDKALVLAVDENVEFRRHIETQTVLPCAETVPMLLWALLASGQILMRNVDMRKVDGWETLSVARHRFWDCATSLMIGDDVIEGAALTRRDQVSMSLGGVAGSLSVSLSFLVTMSPFDVAAA